MEFNLAIDQGNSGCKLYLFEGLEPVSSKRYDNITMRDIDDFIAGHSVKCAIRSSVVNEDADFTECLRNRFEHFVELTSETDMPMAIDYRTPDTLGRDRIAAAIGALSQARGKAIMIVDVGTAMTLDVVSDQGHYLGGCISPGLEMRLSALHGFTDRLPLVLKNGDTPLIGYDTATAIRSGVVNGVASEIEGMARKVADAIGKPVVYITGGDCRLVAEKMNIEVIIDELLLAKGLNSILHYHNENK